MMMSEPHAQCTADPHLDAGILGGFEIKIIGGEPPGGCAGFSFREKKKVVGRSEKDGKMFGEAVFQGGVEFHQQALVGCIYRMIHETC